MDNEKASPNSEGWMMRAIAPGKGVYTAPMIPIEDEDGNRYLMVEGPLTFTPDPNAK